MGLDFDKRFKIPMLGLWLNRTHPELQRTKMWVLQSVVVGGVFTLGFLVIFYNIIFVDFINEDFHTMCKNGTLSIVYVMSVVQYCVLLNQRKSLLKLIKNVKKDYELMKYLSREEQAIVEKFSGEAVFICKYWFYIAVIGAHLFMFRSFILMLYYYCIGDFKLVLYYELKYPEYIEERRSNLLLFIIIYCFTAYYGYYSGVMYASYVPLGPMMMLHACGQLEIVKKRIGELFDDTDDEVLMEKIKSITKQLQYIYRFVDLIQDVFRIAYEITLKTTTIILPVTGYEVLKALERGELSIEFLTFIIGGFLISSSPCYYSDLLMEKGEVVRMALYECRWEQHYSKRIHSSVLILLGYSLRPMAIRTLFKTMCLETLSDVFQQAYTIFNLMNAALEN